MHVSSDRSSPAQAIAELAPKHFNLAFAGSVHYYQRSDGIFGDAATKRARFERALSQGAAMGLWTDAVPLGFSQRLLSKVPPVSIQLWETDVIHRRPPPAFGWEQGCRCLDRSEAFECQSVVIGARADGWLLRILQSMASFPERVPLVRGRPSQHCPSPR